jgi:uncharacterized protein (TIGR02246 family)
VRDEAEIRRLIQAHADAWNRRDAKAAAAVFHPDADVRFSSGLLVRGRAALERVHEEGLREDSAKGGTVHSHPPRSVRIWFIRPDVALCEVEARYDARTATPTGQLPPPDRSLLFLVLTKDQGRWGVMAQRNLGRPPQ